MIIIIDGYNLLKQIYPACVTDEKEREWLIKQLNNYAQRKGHHVVVVFDGGIGFWPTKEQAKYSTVVFSGVKQSADEYIVYLASQYKGREVLLVSSDRKLQDQVADFGVVTIGSLDFYPYLKAGSTKRSVNVLPDKGALVKTTQRDSQDIDILMQQAIKMPYYKEMASEPDRNESSKTTISKKEKEILKILQKL